MILDLKKGDSGLRHKETTSIILNFKLSISMILGCSFQLCVLKGPETRTNLQQTSGLASEFQPPLGGRA